MAALVDGRISAEHIAHQDHVSVRHLHALFRGSSLIFAVRVRHERLLLIRRDLLDPASLQLSAALIAARWGVHDRSHLGRALKRECGEMVSDLRRGHQNAGGSQTYS